MAGVAPTPPAVLGGVTTLGALDPGAALVPVDASLLVGGGVGGGVGCDVVGSRRCVRAAGRPVGSVSGVSSSSPGPEGT